MAPMSKIVLLDNIRSTYNVGAIFRTADGAGVGEIILVGYTPAPIDRFGREEGKIAKTSLGASATVPWRAVATYPETIALLDTYKKNGYCVVAVEQGEGSVSLYDFKVPEKVIYMLGNEVDGVAPELLAVADTKLELPMAGKKESLNVSVTAGIVLYHKST